MATIHFTKNLQRHVPAPTVSVAGTTVRECLDLCFEIHPRVRGYVLDDQGALRRHMVVFVDSKQIADRRALSDQVVAKSEIYVMQALSGG